MRFDKLNLYCRLILSQLSYSIIINIDTDLNKTLELIIKSNNIQGFNKKDVCYNVAVNLVDSIQVIDSYIEDNISSNWSIKRIAKVPLSILRVGIYEIMNNEKIKLGTAISDYIEIAKMLDHHKEIGFINNLLDKAAVLYKRKTA